MATGAMLELEEAWRSAIAKEKESFSLYSRLARMTEDASARQLFEFLAQEEAGHARRLQEEFDRAFMQDM
ncbi:MAG: ferritin family protein [Anaerolineae bacterium]